MQVLFLRYKFGKNQNMEELMEKLKELRDMIESCIAVGDAALEIPHSEENELIMKGQMMAYDQVLGLIDSLISK